MSVFTPSPKSQAYTPAAERNAPAGAAAISLTGLEKSFGANRVLRGINLHIPA